MDNDMDVDTEILKYLDKNGVVWREKLRKDISKLVDKSPITIDKRLTKLKKANKLDFIKGDEAVCIGIKVKGMNASYIISNAYLETKKHLDNVFEDFKNETDEKLKEIELIEISSHNGYLFTPKQLDYLVEHLDSKNNKLVKTCMHIIYNHFKNNIFPLNTDNFISKLKIVLKNYKEDVKDGKNVRIDSIFILGYYEDDAVIDQLIDDVNENRTNDAHQYAYMHEFTAKVIEKNKDRLYQFQKELTKKGEEQREIFLRQVRYKARSFIFPEEYKPKTTIINGQEVEIL
jgi:hypothetical protein